MSNGIKGWSLHRVLTYEECKYRAFLMFVQKAETGPPGDAINRGLEVHKQFEDFILGKTDTLEFDFFAGRAATIRDQEGKFVEEKWGFDDSWNPTGYFDDNIWCRLAIDAGYTCTTHDEDDDHTWDQAEIWDWKTGKINPVKYRQQGQLYAIGTFAQFPNVVTVEVNFGYVDHDYVDRQVYSRSDAEVFKPVWERRANALLNETSWKANPNKWTCRFCDVKQHCQFAHED